MELNRKVDELKEEMIAATQKLVRVKSLEAAALPGMPYGKDVNTALETALGICSELGLKTVNVDGYVGYGEIGEGDDYVAILGHVDVVPEGEGWTYPPYAAEIHDGKIFGRGTLDDKGPMMAALYGLKAVLNSDLKLSKKVRVLFGTNEESGCGEIKHYLEVEKPPISGFTPDAQYPMISGEKGITYINIHRELKKKSLTELKLKYVKGGLVHNSVPDYCEAAIETKNSSLVTSALEAFVKKTGHDIKAEVKEDLVVLKSVGVSAHGSLPHMGKNSIMQLLLFIGELDLGDSDISDAIAFINKSIGMEYNGESFGLGLEDKQSGKLTFNVGVIEMNEDKLTLKLNIRYPVTNTYEDFIVPFNSKLEGTGFTVEILISLTPLFFPEDHPLIKTLQKVYVEQTGLDPTPLSIGGGTYAKEMANIVAFGPIFPGKPDLDHQVNEYIEIDDLVMNAKIYAHAIYELAK